MEDAILAANENGVALRAGPVTLLDRSLLFVWRFTTYALEGEDLLSAERLTGNGTLTDGKDHVSAGFSGESGSYQLRLNLPRVQIATGVGARIRLRGWESINYICIGYTWEGTFEHVKAVNPARDHWFDFLVGHGDLAWGWRHGWMHPEDREVSDIRLYIKGTPGNVGHLDVAEMVLWQEGNVEMPRWLEKDCPVPACVLDAILDYERKCVSTYTEQAQAFLDTGKCPIAGEVLLDWPATSTLPPALNESGTYQFSWHALHPATMLMLHAHDSGEMAPLFAARDFVAGWFERSYFRPDPNLKYAWYDHGTAERCLALVQLYISGQRYGFDCRFMTQLRHAIFRHAQLLASEAFYAGHQPTRYHNHAWFQDLALLAVSLTFREWPCVQAWGDTALWRLQDQFAMLIQRDKGHAVFVENSIGYHHGVQRIVEFAGNLAVLSGRESSIPAIAEELHSFSTFFRYPDPVRTVSNGDTFRSPNLDAPNPRGQVPYDRPEVTVLPRAGYAIVKADHVNRPFMLTMLATSLSKTHKHEDNLALTLYFDGVEWLIDPSFHSHEYAAPIPAYLRSAAAHNGVFVPDLPYSITPGLARLKGGREGDKCWLNGSHDAYKGLRVTRELTCSLDRLEITCRDTLSAQCVGAQLRFHCGEHVSAQVAGGQVTLTHPGSDLSLVLDFGAAVVERVRGNAAAGPRMGGIVGHGFLEHESIDTVIVDYEGKMEMAWRLQAS